MTEMPGNNLGNNQGVLLPAMLPATTGNSSDKAAGQSWQQVATLRQHGQWQRRPTPLGGRHVATVASRERKKIKMNEFETKMAEAKAKVTEELAAAYRAGVKRGVVLGATLTGLLTVLVLVLSGCTPSEGEATVPTANPACGAADEAMVREAAMLDRMTAGEDYSVAEFAAVAAEVNRLRAECSRS